MNSRLVAAAFAVALATALVACVTGGDRTPVAEFADYQTWTRVNTETITGDVTAMLGRAHEGNEGFREVYVNELGRPVALGGTALPYPAGTILVKESLGADGTGSKGELSNLTIMVKREGGYDPDNGDWEYVMTTPATLVRMQGKLGMCINCHAAARDSDFVFTRR
jgi:hypothetical protein